MAFVTKEELVSLQKKLKRDAAIGEKFGISRQAVHQLRVKFGVPSVRESNPLRDKEIISMYNAGKSVAAIAKKFNLSVSFTYTIIRGNKKKKNGKK